MENGVTLIISSDYLSKAPPPNIITLGVKPSTYNWGLGEGQKHQSIRERYNLWESGS